MNNTLTERHGKPGIGKITRGWRCVIAMAALAPACLATVIVAVGAYTPPPVKSAPPATPTPIAQPVAVIQQPGQEQVAGRWQSRLTLQPRADRLRYKLGKRFLGPGRELSLLTGRVTVEGLSSAIRITRLRGEQGEQVDIEMGSGQGLLSWNDREGARFSGRSAEAKDRRLAERLVLDSPEQFVLAQLRGASYFTLAREVIPKEAEGLEDYQGPSWDLVRVGEPIGQGNNKPESLWRVYHINNGTGLIDKIMSEVDGEVVTAELSGWVTVDGETFPTRIRWIQHENVVMELSLDSQSHQPAR